MNISRRKLFLGLLPIALAPMGSALAQDQGEFHLGRVWQVREYEPNGSVWEGTWTRRGNSPIFDAQWRNSYTAGVAHDVIEFRGVRDGSVTLYRYSLSGYYYGRISRDGDRIRRGGEEIPGYFASGEQAGNGDAVAQDAASVICR